MPKAYPQEFRHRAVALVRAGRPATEVALSLGISRTCLRNWVRQDRIDHGDIVGRSTVESVKLKEARKRIRELEREVEVLKVASKLLGEDAPHPKGSIRGTAEG